MEKYCVSLEIAKKLRQVGWDKETIYGYIPFETFGLIHTSSLHPSESGELWSAPIAEEILEELPKIIKEEGYEYHLTIEKESFFVRYENYEGVTLKDKDSKSIEYVNDKLSDALALLYIQLKTNKLI